MLTIWLELCTSYGSSCQHHLHHPCSKKIRNGDIVVPAYPACPEKKQVLYCGTTASDTIAQSATDQKFFPHALELFPQFHLVGVANLVQSFPGPRLLHQVRVHLLQLGVQFPLCSRFQLGLQLPQLCLVQVTVRQVDLRSNYYFIFVPPAQSL